MKITWHVKNYLFYPNDEVKIMDVIIPIKSPISAQGIVHPVLLIFTAP